MKKIHLPFLSFLAFLMFGLSITTQAQLNAGDLAIVYFRFNPEGVNNVDSVVILTLKNLTAGEKFILTPQSVHDNNGGAEDFDNTGGGATTGAGMIYTVPAGGIPAFSLITYDQGADGGPGWTEYSGVHGAAILNPGQNLGGGPAIELEINFSTGNQLFLFRDGGGSEPASDPVFIYGIEATVNAWLASPVASAAVTDPLLSLNPPSLIAANASLDLTSTTFGPTRGAYMGTKTFSSQANALSEISNAANWTTFNFTELLSTPANLTTINALSAAINNTPTSPFTLPPPPPPGFTHRMEIPDLYDRRADSLTVDIENHDFGIPGLNNVETMAYNHKFGRQNDYLGPTLTWYVGDNQSTHIKNQLPMNSGMRTTVHWHGADIPAYMDGGPHQYFDPGGSFTAEFPVLDRPTTLWYHPHAEDITYTQVQMGLAGIIIVRERGDTIAQQIPNTYGHDDIPLIIQDIRFIDSTQSIDTTQGPKGSDKERMIVVNGTVKPYLDVYPQPISFRILDGSTRNAYMLSFVTDTADPGNTQIPFHLLASDGGYLPDSTRRVTQLETGPGIRNRVIVDFASVAGNTVYLVNSPDDLAGGIIGGSTDRPTPILQLRVDNNPAQPVGGLPRALPPILAVDTMGPDTTRTILLTGDRGRTGEPFGIDSSQYDFNKINTVVKLNTVEDWVVKNQTPFAHPFHVHLVQFYVMKIKFGETDSLVLDDPGFPREALGPKDDVLIWPGEEWTLRMRFHTYAQPKPFNLDSSAYMYHCHILTHEDGYYRATANTLASRSPWGMMQQFAVWDGTITSIDKPLAEEMTLYPNPAENKLYLNAESPRMSTIRLIDIQGRILMEKVVPPFAGSIPIDVSDIARGMILVEWDSSDGKQTKKVVLE